MNKEKISEALSYLDDDIIKETDALRQKSAKRHGSGILSITTRPWFKMSLVAAAFVLIVIGGGIAVVRTGLLGAKGSKSEAYSAADNTAGSVYLNSIDGESGESFPHVAAEYDPDSVETSVRQSAVTAEGSKTVYMKEYDMSYVRTFCEAHSTDGKVNGTYGFDLSEDADYYVSTGEMWVLEEYDGMLWIPVEPKDEIKWSAPGYIIGQHAGTHHFSKTFNLDAYGELKEGTYRLVKDITVHKTVEGSENTYDEIVYFQFDVKY